MKALDILMGFELEINKIDDQIQKPVTNDSVYWINQAMFKFVKERFNGNLPHRTSYEQNEKRTVDLNRLYTTKELSADDTSEHATYYEYVYIYPKDLMFILNEDVVITDLNGEHKYDTSVFECTTDSFMYRITNSLTDFHYKYHKARPLRVSDTQYIEVQDPEDNYNEEQRHVKLLTDKQYLIEKYQIGYLRKPQMINQEDPDVEYTDFPDYIWLEIIKIAAQMYIENQADKRYQSLTNEVNTQE